MPTTRTTKPVTLKLDPDTLSALAKLSEARQRTPHWMMRQAVKEYVEREQKRDAFGHAADAAWSDFEATGLHLTGPEADAWLQQLEAGNDVPPPECHK